MEILEPDDGALADDEDSASPRADASDDAPPSLSAGDAIIFAFRRNIVVAASAGTGKTHRLTALYVLLTLGLTSMGARDDHTAADPVTPDRIVATTFSRAAAREIEGRVERELSAIAAWDGEAPLRFGSILRARMAALGETLSVAELRRRAEAALGRWPSAKIDTLHGVARRIVQRHALTIGLPPGARVLDEEEAQALGDLAVDEALGAALGEGGDRAEAARGLIVSAGGVAGARQKVQRLLDRLDEEGLTPRDLALADHAASARETGLELLAITRDVAALGTPGFKELAAEVAAALAPLADAPALDPARLDALAEPLAALFTRRATQAKKRPPCEDALASLIDAQRGTNKAERAASLLAWLRMAPDLAARERRLVDLLEDARARVAAAKRRAGGLGFGDLLRIARDALRDQPEIARAVREGIDVLLVDEFQDTSRVQRDLVYLLRERDDATDARPAGLPPSAEGLIHHGLFLVGDRKQSIYGFRGADVAVFSRIAAELCGRAAADALSLPEQPFPDEPIADFVALRESRRSLPAILGFVNTLSTHDFSADRDPSARPRDFEMTYGPAEHLVPAPETGPGGRIILVRDDGASPEDAEPIVREASGAAREAHVAAAIVARLVREQRAACREIAVLARRRSTIPLVELALARLEVPYVVAGRALYDAQEVRDVAALLRLILDPRDRLALAAVLRGPVVALSDAALAALALPGRGLTVPLEGRWPGPKGRDNGPDPHLDAVDLAALDPAERARLDAFRARFAELRRAALRLTPGEAIRAAIAASDLDRVLAALPRAEARIGNLDRLVGIARRRGGTLASFVRWLERRIRDDADEAEAAVFSPEDDAVRLTTIHASKGLDFPVVVLVDLNAEPRADAGGLGLYAGAAAAPTLVVRHYAPRPGPREGLAALAGIELTPVPTVALRDAQIEARARELAERRRLTYVAVTRPKDALVLIGSANPPRHGSAWRAIHEGREGGALDGVITDVEDAHDLLASAEPLPPRIPAALPPEPRAPARPARTAPRAVTLGIGALALFDGCPRRYRLRHLVGLEEPAQQGQLDLFGAVIGPAPEGDGKGPDVLPARPGDDGALDPRPPTRAAHRVLSRYPLARWGERVDPRDIQRRLAAEGLAANAEAEPIALAVAAFLAGPFAREIRDASASIHRDRSFVITLATTGRSACTLALRGAADLVVERRDGSVDVLDFQLDGARARRPGSPASRARGFELRAAALASRAESGDDTPVRAGVVHLGAHPSPTWLSGSGPDSALAPDDHQRFQVALARLARRFADARLDDAWSSVPIAACQRLRCGFIEACHGERRARALA